MGQTRLPSLPQGTAQLSSARVHESPRMPATGNDSRAARSPRPPRRGSGGLGREPAAAAHQHGDASDTTQSTLGACGARGTRSRRTPETKVAAIPAQLRAETVAELLRNHDTRDATLSAMEGHTMPFGLSVSLAAAPVLNEIKASDTSEVAKEEWDRVCLLLARLIADAGDDAGTVWGAANSEGRWARLGSEGTPLARALRKPAKELTLEDARTVALAAAHQPPVFFSNWKKAFDALGFGLLEGITEVLVRKDPLRDKCVQPFASACR